MAELLQLAKAAFPLL